MQMEVDQIRIRHCRLRLCRTGGWSWGPDSRQLLAAATRALPQLLARELERLLGGRQESLTIQRLAVRVPVALGELRQSGSAVPEAAAVALLSQGITQGLAQALSAQFGIAPGAPAPEPEPVRCAAPSREPEPEGRPERDAVAVLVAWYRQGRLLRLLRHFSAGTAAAWERMMLAGLGPTATPGTRGVASDGEVRDFSRAVGHSLARVESQGGRRLVLLAALLDRFPGLLSAVRLTRLMDEFTPRVDLSMDMRERPAAEATHPAQTENAAAQPGTAKKEGAARPKEKSAARPKSAPAGVIDVAVPSVLPFVALGVLDRLGYWEALWASLKAEGLEGEMGCFGVALAYKLLPAPRCGWLRPAPEQLTAALAGGFREEVTAQTLTAFARGCAPVLPPADGFLKLLLTEGHDPSWPLLLHKVDAGPEPLWLMIDAQGAFPLGWHADQIQVLEAMPPMGGNTLLVSEAATEARLMADLDQRRLRFITALPPSRGEAWRSVDRRRRWWTNDKDAQAGWLLNQCRDLPALTQTAQNIHQALICDRPVLLPQTRGPTGRFEQSLALAAGSALATLAWQLWGKVERTDPLLALDRLGHWGGRVTIDREKITIRPAVGQRYLDLSRNGFFATAAGIPWLGGRPLEFAGL